MTAHASSQLMFSTLGALAQMATSRHNATMKRDELMQQYALAELQYSAWGNLIDAVITRRVEAVRETFLQVLHDQAAHAQHYMEQQGKFAAAELDATDPFRRIELRKRITDIDIELRQIRLDARQLYDRMTEVLLLIGTASLPLDMHVAKPLMLSLPKP